MFLYLLFYNKKRPKAKPKTVTGDFLRISKNYLLNYQNLVTLQKMKKTWEETHQYHWEIISRVL